MERFKIFKNDEGIFRVQISDSLGTRWLLDEDLMIAVISSHKSKILDFYSQEHAEDGIKQVLTKERLLRDLWLGLQYEKSSSQFPSDTFKPIV